MVCDDCSAIVQILENPSSVIVAGSGAVQKQMRQMRDIVETGNRMLAVDRPSRWRSSLRCSMAWSRDFQVTKGDFDTTKAVLRHNENKRKSHGQRSTESGNPVHIYSYTNFDFHSH